MPSDSELLIRVTTYLQSYPGTSARDIAQSLHVNRSELNSLLYRLEYIFEKEGDAPPLWSLGHEQVVPGGPPEPHAPLIVGEPAATSAKHHDLLNFDLLEEEEEEEASPTAQPDLSAFLDSLGTRYAADAEVLNSNPPPVETPKNDGTLDTDALSPAAETFREFDRRLFDEDSGALPNLEQQLRSRLTGKNLVLEAHIDEDDVEPLEEILRQHLDTGTSVAATARRFPATYVTYLVGKGIHTYQGGELWTHMIPKIRDSVQDRGTAFIAAIDQLGLDPLPALDEEGAQKYMSRILAHGGLPRSNVKDMAEAVLTRMSRGAATSDDVVAQWNQYPSMFEQLDKPAQRFVRYGGDPARDFIQRMMDLISLNPKSSEQPEIDALGLPPYVIDDVVAVLRSSTHKPRTTGSRVRAPIITLHPSAVSGPSLELPPAPREMEYPIWRITADGSTTSTIEIDATSLSGESVPLEPARSWEVSLHDQATGVEISWAIEGLSDRANGLLLFDGVSFQLLRNQQVIRGDSVMAVFSEATTLVATGRGDDGPPAVLYKNPPMPGRWSEFSRDIISLEKVTSLVATASASPAPATVFVKVRKLPEIRGTIVAGAKLADGSDVYFDDPLIVLPSFDPRHRGQWGISVVIDGAEVLSFSDHDADDRGAIFLGDLGDLADRNIATYDVIVRGPLGTDMRRRFGVIRGLEFNRPRRIIEPEKRIVTTLKSDDHTPPLSLEIPFDPGVSEARVTVPNVEGEDLELRLEIARLTWGLAQAGTKTSFSGSRLNLAKSDIEAHESMTLVVRTNMPDQSVSLSVRTQDGDVILWAPTGITTSDGRWNFPLGGYVDSIQKSANAVSLLTLNCGDIERSAVAVTSIYGATFHDVSVAFDDDGGLVDLRVREDQPFRGRHAIFWSTQRPWEPPVSAEIDDAECDDFIFYVRDLRPGSYRLQLTLDDPSWRKPIRPAPSPLVWSVKLGTPQEIEDWLTEPRTEVGEQALEMFLAGAVDRAYVELLADKIEPDHLAGALMFFASQSRSALADLSLVHTLRAIAASHGSTFWEALATRAVECDRHSATVLMVLTVPFTRDVSFAEVGQHTRSMLWERLPPIAAAMDFASDSEEAQDRCHRKTEWHPASGTGAPSAFGPPDQQLLEMTSEGLEEVAAMFPQPVDLTPRVFRMDEFQLPANLEWLRAAKSDPGPVVEWSRRAAIRDLNWSTLPPSLAATADALVLKRKPRPFASETTTGAIAAVPYGLLIVALDHTVNPDSETQTTDLLIRAASFAPQLLVHDLILAMAIVHMRAGAT